MNVLGSLIALQGITQAGGTLVEPHTGPVIPLVGSFVGLMVIAALVAALAKRLQVPFTVALVVAGAGLAWLADRWTVLAPIGTLEVTPDLVFFVLLPTLIFQSAFHLDARSLRANLGPTLTLAVPGLLISTALIGTIIRFGGGTVGVPVSWAEALLLGSILSATDPVAVISLFGQLGAPKRLTVLVEGESLFNDATAIVLSRIILGVMAAGAFTTDAVVSGAVEFGAVFFGGLLVGAVLAGVAGLIIARVRSDAFLEITATTVLAYLSFYVAEHNLRLSGVMAVVAAGVLIGGWGKTKISPSIVGYLENFWDYTASVANALIFLLVGLAVNLGALVDSLPVLVWVVAAMLVSRAVVIFTLVPLAGRLPGAEPVSFSYRAVMYWGGLRGGIALAIALSLPDTVALKETFVTLTTGAVLFTLLVQGLTIERLVRHFRLDVPPLSDRFAHIEGMILAKQRALEELPILEAGGLFAPRVASGVRQETEHELETLRGDLATLRDHELDLDQERRILYTRSFGTEKTLHYEMFTKGHLTEGAYRDLVHSVDLQSDAIRHSGRLPEFTLHPPGDERIETVLFRVLARGPGFGGLVERLRESRAERDYEVAWARFHGDARVIGNLAAHRDAGTHRREPLDDVLTHYRYWRENARTRLDQMTELFPEFVSTMHDRLAHRLALQSEREAIEEGARAGSLPPTVAREMLEQLADRLVELGASRTGKLAAEPEELLRKVPFFQGLPAEEFNAIAGRLKRRTAPVGDPIVRQGERGSSLFLVARGVVRVTLNDGERDVDIATLMAGDFFGEMALLRKGVRTATCRAVTPCALYELARADVDAVAETCPSMTASLERADRARRAELKEAGADLGDVV